MILGLGQHHRAVVTIRCRNDRVIVTVRYRDNRVTVTVQDRDDWSRFRQHSRLPTVLGPHCHISTLCGLVNLGRAVDSSVSGAIIRI